MSHSTVTALMNEVAFNWFQLAVVPPATRREHRAFVAGRLQASVPDSGCFSGLQTVEHGGEFLLAERPQQGDSGIDFGLVHVGIYRVPAGRRGRYIVTSMENIGRLAVERGCEQLVPHTDEIDLQRVPATVRTVYDPVTSGLPLIYSANDAIRG